MTGEITLRGLVMPIGGVKEKVLAARRAGINMVILPARNRKDIVDVPADAQKELTFVYVTRVEDLIKTAFGDGQRDKPKPKRKSKRKTSRKTPKAKAKSKEPASRRRVTRAAKSSRRKSAR